MQSAPWVIPLITAFVSIIGVVVGSSLQYFFSRSAEARRHERTLRFDAYTAYMRSVGEAETMRTTSDSQKRNEIFSAAIAAKARVCMHGSEAVVRALEGFESQYHGQVLTPDKRRHFATFVNEIRKEAGAPGGLVDTKIVNSILFGPEPQTANNPPEPTC